MSELVLYLVDVGDLQGALVVAMLGHMVRVEAEAEVRRAEVVRLIEQTRRAETPQEALAGLPVVLRRAQRHREALSAETDRVLSWVREDP